MLRYALALISITFCFIGNDSAAETQFVSIGAGEVGGGYYTTSINLCEPINRQKERTFYCSTESTYGSIYNLTMLAKGELDFAFVQSDWQRAAYQGTGPFENKAITNLRSVLSLYPETVTILAGRDSGIHSSMDLKGKRIDIGLPSSGRHATAAVVLARAGVDPATFGVFAELTQSQAIKGLCNGTIDASFFVVGHPSQMVAKALNDCGARIIAPSSPAFVRIFSGAKEFDVSTIPASTYPQLLQDIDSYAVFATIVTRADVAPNIVNTLVESTLKYRDYLTRNVPQLANMTVHDLRSKGLTAPLHPAALQTFERMLGKTEGN